MNKEMIVCDNVSKTFETSRGSVDVIGNVNLTVYENELLVLFGPGQCGKSTLLNCMSGLEPVTSGKVTINGKIIDSPGPDRGVVYQRTALFPWLTVMGNVEYGPKVRGMSKNERREKAQYYINLVGLEGFENSYPNQLSGGMQQRVGIARAYCNEPDVLFMDEPLSNLDAKLRLEMRSELKRLHVDTDSTFVYVTHDQMEAMALATKICLMEKGKLQQYAPPLEVYDYPANLFVADFVGNPTMNFLPVDAKRVSGNTYSFSMLGKDLLFKGNCAIEEDSFKAVVGIRPEFIKLGEGQFSGVVYTTLPSGMETTVKIKCGDDMVTAVVFGSVDYSHSLDMNFSVSGNGILLFSKESGKMLSTGTIEMMP